MPANKTEPMYSPGQVAERLGVGERTVRRWATTGVLPSHRTVAGQYLVSESTVLDLERLVAAKLPLNARTLKTQLAQEDRTPPP